MDEIIDDAAAEAPAEETPQPESTRSVIEKAVAAQKEGSDDPKSGAELDEAKAKRFAQAEREEAARKERETTQPKAAPVSHVPPADFAKLPPHIQQALQRREEEVSNGFKVLQDYKGLEQFKGYIDTARMRDPSISFAKVMQNAVEWERSLLSNPEHTVRHVINLAAQARGVSPQQFFQNLTRGAGAQPQQQQRQQPNPGLTPQHVQALVQRQFAEREHLMSVQNFMSDPAHPHAQEVAEDMAFLIEQGKATDLQSAYDTAVYMKPDIRAKVIESQRARQAGASNPRQAQIDAARRASKATVGAPRQGEPPARKPDKPLTTRAAIEAAVREQKSAMASGL